MTSSAPTDVGPPGHPDPGTAFLQLKAAVDSVWIYRSSFPTSHPFSAPFDHGLAEGGTTGDRLADLVDPSMADAAPAEDLRREMTAEERARCEPSPSQPAAGLEVVDVAAGLDRLEDMTAGELDELGTRIWRDDLDN